MSLGCYPQISLKEARPRLDDARALVAQGINPYEHRKQQRRAVRFATEHTFEAVFDQWVAFRRLSLKEGRQSTPSQILRVFIKDVLPILGERPIKGVTRPRAGFLFVQQRCLTYMIFIFQLPGVWSARRLVHGITPC